MSKDPDLGGAEKSSESKPPESQALAVSWDDVPARGEPKDPDAGGAPAPPRRLFHTATEKSSESKDVDRRPSCQSQA